MAHHHHDRELTGHSLRDRDLTGTCSMRETAHSSALRERVEFSNRQRSLMAHTQHDSGLTERSDTEDAAHTSAFNERDEHGWQLFCSFNPSAHWNFFTLDATRRQCSLLAPTLPDRGSRTERGRTRDDAAPSSASTDRTATPAGQHSLTAPTQRDRG